MPDLLTESSISKITQGRRLLGETVFFIELWEKTSEDLQIRIKQ